METQKRKHFSFTNKPFEYFGFVAWCHHRLWKQRNIWWNLLSVSDSFLHLPFVFLPFLTFPFRRLFFFLLWLKLTIPSPLHLGVSLGRPWVHQSLIDFSGIMKNERRFQTAHLTQLPRHGATYFIFQALKKVRSSRWGTVKSRLLSFDSWTPNLPIHHRRIWDIKKPSSFPLCKFSDLNT